MKFKPRKFKVGDCVIVTNPKEPSELQFKGTIGIINDYLQVEERNYYYLAPFKVGCVGGQWRENEIELYHASDLEKAIYGL